MQGAFNALNGSEALEVIMGKIREKLVATGEFKQHVTLPLLKFEFDVRVWAYPKNDLNGAPGIVANTTVGELNPADPKVDPNAAPTVAVSTGDILDTPDKERVAAGLEIPRAQSSAAGIVDQRQDQPLAPAPTKAESIQAAIEAARAAKGSVATDKPAESKPEEKK